MYHKMSCSTKMTHNLSYNLSHKVSHNLSLLINKTKLNKTIILVSYTKPIWKLIWKPIWKTLININKNKTIIMVKTNIPLNLRSSGNTIQEKLVREKHLLNGKHVLNRVKLQRGFYKPVSTMPRSVDV